MNLYAEAKSQLDEAERTIRLLREQPNDPNDPNLAKWHKELAEQASQATDLGEVLKLSIKEMDRRDRVSRREINVRLYEIQCDISQARAEIAHSDWLKVVTDAKINEANMATIEANTTQAALMKHVQRVSLSCPGGLSKR